ncbi:hypothetical protein OB955_22140 [Halobacteria archaeon AArc-m2/3/4]|uniref:DUF7437 domain-containing protein n=1 Tax=Natronoglomus mannanivorans TaxID=2979990 RepID=A0ABT2QKD1_9EURY|nr:hypothetical protein [Halobacteria archaeon AArc-m2/3/4]
MRRTRISDSLDSGFLRVHAEENVKVTIDYLQGETTRRGVADELGVPAVEAIAVTEASERIIAVVKTHDPTLSDITFEMDVHDRAIE